MTSSRTSMAVLPACLHVPMFVAKFAQVLNFLGTQVGALFEILGVQIVKWVHN